MLGFLAAFALMPLMNAEPGAYELHERLNELDVAWCKSNPEARSSSLSFIKEADDAADHDAISKACSALDLAISILEGRPHDAADAISLRPATLHTEPGSSIEVRVRWAYEPRRLAPVRIKVSNKNFILRPMEERSFSVNPYAVNPDLRLTPESGFLLPVQVGGRERHVFVSIAKRVSERVALLGSSNNQVARQMGKFVAHVMENPENEYGELPLIEYLFQAEQFSDGRSKVSDCEDLFFAMQGPTTFRATFPRVHTPLAGVVVALPERSRDLNAFYERNGRGRAVKEALDRGWAFVSAVGPASRLNDVLDWLRVDRGVKPVAVLVIKDGSTDVDVSKASAMAFLNTSPRKVEVPFRVFKAADGASSSVESGSLETIGFCQNLVLGAEAIPNIYRFFDSVVHPAQ